MRTEPRGGDPFAVSFRMQTLKTGVWPTFLICIYCTIYYLTTWDEPHRSALLVCTAIAVTSSGLIAVLPMERIVRGRGREPFFVCWSTSLVVLVTVVAWLDGGVSSPLAALYFLPLVFASLSYPFRSMLAGRRAERLRLRAAQPAHARSRATGTPSCSPARW